MILFNYENSFLIQDEIKTSEWISLIISSENKIEGEVSFVFCDDDYLHKLNVEYLQHDTLTDIISFDYSVGNELSGDIFISTERVLDNASDFNESFDNELLRVMSHGVLHLCGYKDKSDEDLCKMREKESEKISMFHVEQ